MHGYDELKTLDWDEEALKIAGITSAQLSKLVPTTKIFSNCNPDLAQKIGIDSKTPFVIGASDGVLSNLGVNAIRKGRLLSQLEPVVLFGPSLIKPQTDKKEEYFVMP